MSTNSKSIPKDPEKRKGTGFDRTGKPQSYKQRVATQLTWMRRCAMGAAALSHSATNFLWIKSHPEYSTSLTAEQRDRLLEVQIAVNKAMEAMQRVAHCVEKYYEAPKTMPPSRARYKARQATKNRSQEAEIS